MSDEGFYKNIRDQFKQVVLSIEEEHEAIAEAQGISSISMGENVGWITGPHDAVKAVSKLIIDGEGYRKEIRELKQLFVDMTFCYQNRDLNPEKMYQDTVKEFKEIVGDDPEFIDKKESES